MSNKEPKSENGLYSLLFNIVIPVFILLKMSDEKRLGPTYALLVAIAFPIIFAIIDFYKYRKLRFIPIAGFISVLMTGLIGLMKLSPEWMAVKEAGIPAAIGLAVIISIYTPFPLIKKMLFNDKIMHIDLINEKLNEKDAVKLFDKRLKISSFLLGATFFISSIINYFLTKTILIAQPGTSLYTEQIGKLKISCILITAIPSTILMLLILWYLFTSIKKVTGLELNEFLKTK